MTQQCTSCVSTQCSCLDYHMIGFYLNQKFLNACNCKYVSISSSQSLSLQEELSVNTDSVYIKFVGHNLKGVCRQVRNYCLINNISYRIFMYVMEIHYY
jgi:hypothetical protein